MDFKRSLEVSEAGNEVSKKARTVKGVQEADVGITAYISESLGGFTGAIKQRYTDFLVNEIDLENKVVYLEDEGIKIPERPKKDTEKSADADSKAEFTEKAREEEKQEFQIGASKRIRLLEIFGEEELNKIEDLLKIPGSSFQSEKVIDNKKERGEIHQLFREGFEGKLDTKTTDKNTFLISLANRSSRVNKQLQQRKRDQNTKDENGVENWGIGPTKEFLHFTLYKENKETMECVSLISKFLRLKPKQMRFSGTKDRRGITSQRVCISKIRVDRVNSLNKTLRGLRIGGFKYEDRDLCLGDLNGNEFLITLRDVQTLDSSLPISSIVESSLNSLKENGFINYYGMQRFGTFSISTHTIGKEILLNNWENAVELILSEQELVLPDSIPARKIWAETKDAKQALELMPRKCIAESSILRHLSNSKKDENGKYSSNDYFFALAKIPRNLRIMYGHAYQSYIWNCVASERLRLFGPKVVEGDLVLDDQSENTAQVFNGDDEDFEEDVRKDIFQRARPVTREEAEIGKFSIDEIVLPTPGFDIKYPENEQLFKVYQDRMGNDGLNPFEMVRKVKEFSFAGSYRSLIVKPKNVEFHIRNYTESAQNLVLTDLELLREGKSRSEQILASRGGDRVAVILKFQLDVSAYATMALREIMKADTSRHGDLCDVRI
ncbi:hypothetical protein WICMUC_001403 [Wickerhamomyces mucosus]|uniref:TRUD domain-containing protein n=1 Tax=Wickerhamomyces mucosus TaxID=1378264 RepID=A0A9P8PU70_9ASCO|nr:hypothetical protein WICMUC_001403 [Wickerhamomyces mucosus]